MAPVWVVLLTVFSVAGPLVGGWVWSSRWQSKRLQDTRKRLIEAERELRAQRRLSAEIGARARGVARSLAPSTEEVPSDPAEAILSMHKHLRQRAEQLDSFRSQYMGLYEQLRQANARLSALKPAAEASLSENLSFQAHLAEVTAERDQLKQRISERSKDPRQRANRVALRNARQEIEELRFQLRMANRAILDLELQLSQAIELARVEVTDPIPMHHEL